MDVDINIPTIDKSKLPEDVQIIKLVKSGKEMGYRKFPNGEEMFMCLYCGKEDNARKPMTTHIWYHFQNNDCRICGQSYTRPDGLRRHMKTAHRGVKYSEFDQTMDPSGDYSSEMLQNDSEDCILPDDTSNPFEITMLDDEAMANVEASIESKMQNQSQSSYSLRDHSKTSKRTADQMEESGWQFTSRGNK